LVKINKIIIFGISLLYLCTCPELSLAEEKSDAEKDLKKEVEMLKEQVQILMKAAEVRQALSQTDEEKKEKEENILNAAGRQYTLMKSGKIGFEYQFIYSHFRYDSLKEANVIEHNSNHNIKNVFILEYPYLDNLTLGSTIPFIYEYDQIGSEGEKDTTDFGDATFYFNYQPMKTGGNIPSLILNAYVTCPSGRSPYEINPEEDLATGSGGYSATLSVNGSKSLDPVLVYGTLSYRFNFPIDNLDYKLTPYTMEKVEPGDTIGLSMGFGFALSYKTSMTIGYSYSYTLKTKRYFKEIEPITYPTSTSASLSIGTSWRFSDKRRMNVTISSGLSNSGNHSVSFAIPMEFDL
jgi:hypothetical protein